MKKVIKMPQVYKDCSQNIYFLQTLRYSFNRGNSNSESLYIPEYFIIKLNILESFSSGADPEPPLAGGGVQVTNEAEGFTETRSAERGRVGEGGHPLPHVGVRGTSPEIFLRNGIKMVHSECILR